MASFPFFRVPYNNYYNYYRPYPNNRINPIYQYNNKSAPNLDNNVQVSSNVEEVQEVCSFSGTCESQKTHQSYKSQESCENKKNNEKRSSNYTTFGPVRFNPDSFSNQEEPILELLGIELYLDDLIILGLLFFLYNEGVKDTWLFIALILLLLT